MCILLVKTGELNYQSKHASNYNFAIYLYLSHIYALLLLILVVLLDTHPQVRHVLAIGQPHDIGAHQSLQLGAHAWKVEAIEKKKHDIINLIPLEL